MKSIKVKSNEYNRLLYFKAIDNVIVQNVHNVEILNNINNKYLWEKIANLNIDKNEKKNINELLFDLKDKEDKIFKLKAMLNTLKIKLKNAYFI